MIEEAAVVVKIEHQQVWVTSGQNSALLFNNLVDDCWRVRCYHCLICF